MCISGKHFLIVILQFCKQNVILFICNLHDESFGVVSIEMVNCDIFYVDALIKVILNFICSTEMKWFLTCVWFLHYKWCLHSASISCIFHLVLLIGHFRFCDKYLCTTMLETYELQTLVILGVFQCRTRVSVRHRHMITLNYVIFQIIIGIDVSMFMSGVRVS
jgi:hypothetical protein